MMERTGWIGERNCAGCRYWSEMIARSIGGNDVEALCLAPEGPCSGKYKTGSKSCSAFARNTHGAVDDPPNYGEEARAAYAAQAAMKHPNGKPVYAPDGTLLTSNGTRSVFDDVDL
jgi:hypothetical protein